MFNTKLLLLGLIVSVVLSLPVSAKSDVPFSLQIGGTGDDSSRGNLGVRAEIETHIYGASRGALDYFWVGSILQNGAFVQFGYALEPGQYCLKGMLVGGVFQCVGETQNLSTSDARWQWQYWPSIYSNDFFYEISPAELVGTNGTWHIYSIEPDSKGQVAFTLDGTHVANVSFKLIPSQEPAMIVAEKAGSGVIGNLGPVEFRNLNYLKADGWHPVDSLVSFGGCGINMSCGPTSPYAVSSVGPNHLVAGSTSGVQKTGLLLWTRGYVTLRVLAPNQIRFHINTILGDRSYSGNASASIPKGLYTHISLDETTSPKSGFLGFLGVKDEFEGWTGDLTSANSSVRVLMDGDKVIVTIWRISPSSLITVVGLSVIAIGACIGVFVYRRAVKHTAAA